MSSRLRLFFLLACVLAFASACAPLPPAKPLDLGAERFGFSGRIAVRGADTKFNAALSWQHGRAGDSILVSGPFGQGMAELSRDERGAHLITAQGERRDAASLGALAQSIFGAPLPVEELAAWVQGRAADAQSDALGRPRLLQRDAWRIEWLEYASERRDSRPRLIELRGQGLEVRLMIDEWDDGATP